MKCCKDCDWMLHCLCLLEAFVIVVTYLVNFFLIYTFADKTSIDVCIASYWLQLFMHKFRDGLAFSLKMEAIFLLLNVILCTHLSDFNFTESSVILQNLIY